MHPLSVRPRRRVGRAVLACALALFAGGCGSDSSSSSVAGAAVSSSATTAGVPADVGASDVSSTSWVVPTTTPGMTPEEAAVLEAYQGYWDTWLEANADPVNPDHPGIERYYTGAAKERLLSNLRTDQLAGNAVRLPAGSQYSHRVEVVALRAEAATLHDCFVDDSILYQPRTGVVLNDILETRLVRVSAVKVGERWLISDSRTVDAWEGVSGCAALG